MSNITEDQSEVEYFIDDEFKLFSFESVTEDISKAFYNNIRINDNHVMTFDPEILMNYEQTIV